MNKPEDNMKLQLISFIWEKLLSTDAVTTGIERQIIANLLKFGNNVFSMSLEAISFKTRLRSSLNDKSLSHLMKIAIESPAELTDNHLEEIVNVWNRKGRRIAL